MSGLPVNKVLMSEFWNNNHVYQHGEYYKYLRWNSIQKVIEFISTLHTVVAKVPSFDISEMV